MTSWRKTGNVLNLLTSRNARLAEYMSLTDEQVRRSYVGGSFDYNAHTIYREVDVVIDNIKES